MFLDSLSVDDQLKVETTPTRNRNMGGLVRRTARFAWQLSTLGLPLPARPAKHRQPVPRHAWERSGVSGLHYRRKDPHAIHTVKRVRGHEFLNQRPLSIRGLREKRLENSACFAKGSWLRFGNKNPCFIRIRKGGYRLHIDT